MKTEIHKESQVHRLLKWRQANLEEWESKRLEGLKNSEKLKRACREISHKYKKRRLETRAKNPVMQKGPNHCAAVIWRLRSPRGLTFEFKNLAEFLRNNANLFNDEDVVFRVVGTTLNCKAYAGIASLRPYKRSGNPKVKVNGSWKGWTWVSGIEEISDPRRADLLARNNFHPTNGVEQQQITT
jgi:hypothetical protein